MCKLMRTTDLVKQILEADKKARNSDSYLYLKVLKHIAEQRGLNINLITVPMFLLHGDKMGFVGFETVRRTRQKLQQHHPELAACDTVEGYRSENEAEYRAYARGEV